jgi:serine/threonine protein kinase
VETLAIGDFGTAFSVSSGGSAESAGTVETRHLTAPAGTLHYVAPELRAATDRLPADAFPCDVYSLGIVFVALVSGVIFNLTNQAPPPSGDLVCAHSPSSDTGDAGSDWGWLRSLIDPCIEADSSRRPTASELANRIQTGMGEDSNTRPGLAFRGNLPVSPALGRSSVPVEVTRLRADLTQAKSAHDRVVAELRSAEKEITVLRRQLGITVASRVDSIADCDARPGNSARVSPVLDHDDLREWLSATGLLGVAHRCPSLRTFRLETLLRRTDQQLASILGEDVVSSEDGQRLVRAVRVLRSLVVR